MRPAVVARRGGGWPPGTAPPVLAEANAPEGLAAALAAGEQADTLASPFPLPEPLLPWAAFEGRALSLKLRDAGEAVELTLLQGAIRTVMHEHPICRVRLCITPKKTTQYP